MTEQTDLKLELMTTIMGAPAAKGSPRVTKTGRAFPHKKSAAYIANVAEQLSARWVGRAPLEGPIHVQIVVVVQRPKRLMRRKDPEHRVLNDRKPDIDNYCKSILDAVTRAQVWVDDGQVSSLVMTKWYAAKGELPCVELSIWRAE